MRKEKPNVIRIHGTHRDNNLAGNLLIFDHALPVCLIGKQVRALQSRRSSQLVVNLSLVREDNGNGLNPWVCRKKLGVAKNLANRKPTVTFWPSVNVV